MPISGDIAVLVEVAIHEQYRLWQAAAIWRTSEMRDVSVVIQVPRAGGAEAVSLERPDQRVEVHGGPKVGQARSAAPDAQRRTDLRGA